MTKVEKHNVGVHIEKNAFVDQGDGTIMFPKGLAITDDSEQRNGTKYDINSMDVSEYKGQVTADHNDTLANIIAKVNGVKKTKNQVLVNSITYAVKENPLAQLAYNLVVNGFSTDFSIETYGPWPDEEDRIYYNSKLIGLSQVVVGNNKGAAVNQIVMNSLEQSKENGLDVSDLEKEFETEFKITANHVTEDEHQPEEVLEEEATPEVKKTEEPAAPVENEVVTPPAEEEVVAPEKEETPEVPKVEPTDEKHENTNKKENDEMKFVTIKNSRDFPVTVTYKNAAGDDKETVLEPGHDVDVSEDQKEAIEKQLHDATTPEVDNSAAIEKAVNAVREEMTSSFKTQFDELKAAFNKSAQEPGFKKTDEVEEVVENEFSKLDYRERHGKQINAAWEYLKLGRAEAAKTLNDINQVNLDALKKDGKVSNSLAISDFGNFVISPELLTDIQGFRNDYTALIEATNWKETQSLEFAWLRRNGDIDMQSVDLEPGVTGNGNLKPISTYTAEPVTSKLEELAAVTPVVNAATRFLAVDLLSDVAAGYRNDYDRKRAQLVVARMQQALEDVGNSANSIPYSVGLGAQSLVVWSQLWATVAERTLNGMFIFNQRTYAIIQQAAVMAGVNGPLSQIFTTGTVPTIFGRPYVIVPNDILPTLNTGETVTVMVDGDPVVIDHAVFYFDMTNFTGRTSGGMQYDLSTEASYEQNGVVKSAYQRNELVLRGSFFRGGAVLDTTRISGMTSAVALRAS